jgi:hypothetical protein
MKKLLVLAAWANGLVAIVLMLLGIIARLAGGILMNHWWANYFYPAGVFLLLGIFLFIGAWFWERKD